MFSASISDICPAFFISTTWNVHGLITFLRTSCMFSFHIRFKNSFSSLVCSGLSCTQRGWRKNNILVKFFSPKINSFPVLCIGRKDLRATIQVVPSVRFSRPWNLWAVPCISYWEIETHSLWAWTFRDLCCPPEQGYE